MTDPRTALNWHPWTPAAKRADDSSQDIYALLSLLMGVSGMMMKNKMCAWIALGSTLAGLANTRGRDLDLKQSLFSVVFALLVLVMNYFGPVPVDEAPQ